MRLLVTVKRHGLPETPITWHVEEETSTVAQLLEQINDIIPIEQGDWGYEDYAVDLKGSNGVNFECLHFQQVGQVFKEDDEIIIRPLLTQDIKVRRVSGRTQITSDGKRLLDGVPFGRPLLRRPDRPLIKIPSRKRRRILQNEYDDEVNEEDEDESLLALREHSETDDGDSGAHETNDRQLVLHADFDDEDSEDDDDFMPGDNEEPTEDSESSSESDEDDATEHEAGEQESLHRNATNAGDDDESKLAEVPDEEVRGQIRKLRLAFPEAPIVVCRYVLDGSKNIFKEAYVTMSLGFHPTKPLSAFTKSSEAALPVRKTRSKKRKAPAEDLEPDTTEVNTPEIDESLRRHYDQNGVPPRSISSGRALSHISKVAQTSLRKARPTQRSNSALSSKSVRFSLDEGIADGLTSTPAIDHHSQVEDSDGDSGESSSDAESSSSSSGSDSDSSEEDSSSDDDVDNIEKSSDDSSSDSDESSDEDEPEEKSSKISPVNPVKPVTASTETSTLSLSSSLYTAPGKGRSSTQLRNERRRKSNALHRYKEKGIVPAGTTIAEFRLMKDLTEETSPEAALDALQVARAEIEAKSQPGRTLQVDEEFEVRRQELLDSLQSGGIEVGLDSPNRVNKKACKTSPAKEAEASDADSTSAAAKEGLSSSSTAQSTHEPPSIAAKPQVISENAVSAANPEATTPRVTAESSKASTPAGVVTDGPTSGLSVTKETASSSTTSSANAPRRAKLNLGAGRRMLFGALGLKAPKSKKDEDKVRDDLMKYVRPVHTPRVASNTAEDDDEEIEDENPEAWREKINYRAVECCYDGVKLSEPPFPFVQRWDPQQQGDWSQKGNRGSKRKKNQRDEPQFYQEQRPSKRQKQRKNKHTYAEQQEYLDKSYEPNYQEDSLMESEEPTQETRLQSDDVEGEVDQQLMNDIHDLVTAEVDQVSQSPEDLVALPDDPSTLSDLKVGHAKPGMTIAFKELTMSEETNWQPEISTYRTAVVNKISENGELEITLALRDRINSEKLYDAETGERRYGRFEMPAEDEDADEEEDNGIRNVLCGEFVEPKIVQEAPSNLVVDATEEEIALPKANFSTESRILSHEDEAADPQYSHVTETPLNSDAPESQPQAPHQHSVPESPQPNLDIVDRELEDANHPRSVDAWSTPNHSTAHNSISCQKLVTPATDRGKTKESFEKNNADDSITWGEEDTSALLEVPALPVAPDARLKISKMMRDAGWRSSVPSSVLKSIRPDGMESPGDAQVFEKLMKDMTEIPSNPVYSPKFRGLHQSSPVKKLNSSASPDPSSSPVRVDSSWRTVDSQVPSSPPVMDEEGQSSWVTENTNAVPSPSINVSVNRPAKSAQKPRVNQAKEVWAKIQTTARRMSFGSESSRKSPEAAAPAFGSDGSNDPRKQEKSVDYPELSIGSSFTSQISDHGRQPDVDFDDSVGLNGDTPRAPAFEEEPIMNQADDATDVEEEHPSRRATPTNSRISVLLDQFLDVEDPESPFQAKVNPAQAASNTPDVFRGSPSSDDAFPTAEEMFSQRSPTREKTAPIRSKPTKHIKSEKVQKKASVVRSEDDDAETTPKASQRNSRASKSGLQIRKSPRHSQPRASQSRLSLSQSPQDSQIVDLTLSSDIEEAAEGSEAEPPRRFRKYALSEDDDDDSEEPIGWVQKKSSSQKPTETRKQTTAPKASSQSSARTARRKTTARF